LKTFSFIFEEQFISESIAINRQKEVTLQAE
jgi:hypothetical protein